MASESYTPTEQNAVDQLGAYTDDQIAYTIYRTVLTLLAAGVPPQAVIAGIESTVKVIRGSARVEQLKEMAVPGVQ